MAYHSADYSPAEATAKLQSELAEEGLRLVAEVHNEETDVYAVLAANETAAFVAFRGSATVKNVLTDLDFVDDPATTERFRTACGADSSPGGTAAGCGLDLSAGSLQLHGGFVKAYMSLRPQLLEAMRHVENLDLHVTGHSMGGALAMLASLDLKRREPAAGPISSWGSDISLVGPKGGLRNRPRVHRTYTFAAPRVGDVAFAETFDATFPAPEEHWALQAAQDAVPHLPFAAWGFQHPRGVLKLTGAGGAVSGGSGGFGGLSTADGGDSVESLRPRDGKLTEWASCHDITAYAEQLREMIAADGAEALGEEAVVEAVSRAAAGVVTGATAEATAEAAGAVSMGAAAKSISPMAAAAAARQTESMPSYGYAHAMRALG